MASDTGDTLDAWAATHDRSVARGSGYYERYDEVLDAVANVACPVPGVTVLDIGTGTGNLALRCLERGAVVVGVDPSAGMLAQALCKRPTGAALEFMRVGEPFLHLPFGDASFDGIVSTYAFHHVPRELHHASIAEAFRVLRPGGLWALGDVAFEDEAQERAALHRHEWLEAEEFALVDAVRAAVEARGAELRTMWFTDVTQVLWAAKPGG